MSLQIKSFIFLLLSLYLLSCPLPAHAETPFFGVTLTDPESPFFGLKLTESWEPPGVKIIEVDLHSPASSADLQLDDVIVAIEGIRIYSLGEFLEAFKEYAGEEEVSVSLNRAGAVLDVRLVSSQNLKEKADALVKKHKIIKIADPETLFTEPLLYGGTRIAVCLEFAKLIANDEALFSSGKRRYKVSHIQATTLREGKYTLAVRVMGITEKGRPHLEYLGHEPGDLIQFIAEVLRE